MSRPPANCGTDSGYYRHIRTLGQPACPDCLNAHRWAVNTRNRRRRTPRQRGYGDGLDERARQVILLRSLGVIA